MVGGHIREFPADFLKHFGIHVTPVAQGITLGDQAYLAFAGFAIQCPEAAGATLLNTVAGPLASLFKAVPDNPLGGPASEHLHLGGHFIGRSLAQTAALADVLAFAVLADHQHIDVL